MLHSFSEHPRITSRSGWLHVDGRQLRADVLPVSRSERIGVSPHQLTTILTLGRAAISQGIEDFYDQIVYENPGLTFTRPSVFTAHLGTEAQADSPNGQIFTEKGRNNTATTTQLDEVHEAFHGHWNAVAAAGFIPEIQTLAGTLSDDGFWLALRKPTLDQVAQHWLLHQENPELAKQRSLFRTVVEGKDELDPEEKAHGVRCIRLYRSAGEEAIALFSATNGDSIQSRQRIGLELTICAMKATLGDTDGYHDGVKDALTSARWDDKIDEVTVRAIENSTF